MTMNTLVNNRRWIYTQRPEAEVGVSHYRCDKETLDSSDIADNSVMVQAHYWSVDPYMRIQQASQDTWEEPHPLNTVQGGGMVGKVVAVGAAVAGITPGDWVNVYGGWQEYVIVEAADVTLLDPAAAPVTTSLSVLGMPGRTAYFGLLEAGKPQPGETLLVSGAAGAVGSTVGQIGKIQQCRVVGIAGSAEKCRWLTDELGFDAAINYRDHPTQKVMRKAIEQVCTDGVDIYYDNVGGYITDATFECINRRARIIICGQISQYSGNLDNPSMGPRFLHRVLYTRATIQGILARDYNERMPEMLAAMTPWVSAGKIHYRETYMDGFESLPDALAALFTGSTQGKLIVRA